MSQNEAREDVLYAFAVEPNQGRETLARYLNMYPQFKNELIDLSCELRLGKSQQLVMDAVDDPGGEAAWSQFASSAVIPSRLANPFAKIRGQAFVAFTDSLRLPRSIVAALRDRLVDPSTIPIRLIESIATRTNTTVLAVQKYFLQEPTTLATMEFKANQKPVEIERTTFEKLVASTELSPEEQAAVLEYLQNDQSDRG